MPLTGPTPGLPSEPQPDPTAERRGGPAHPKLKVLFLCTGNSCRSQMAEAWAQARCADKLEAWSAGTAPKGIDPRAARVMSEVGLTLDGRRSKHVGELSGIRFDHVITLCGHAQENCPFFPGPTRVRHVGFEDPPALAEGAADEQAALRHYRRVRDEIRDFVERLPGLLRETPAGPGEQPATPVVANASRGGARLNLFERYLTAWVAACMVAGLALGTLAPRLVRALRDLEFGRGSQVNVPIAVLIWLMIVPMMMKVDLAAIRNVGKRPRGLLVTLFVNWMVKPFSMALFAWLSFRHLFARWIPPADADQYIAGAIILAAAPCTAMVFVWSQLTDGDPAYTLVQVSVNDLIMLFLFAPIIRFLVSGASSLVVPFDVLLGSVVAFIVIPLAAGSGTRTWLVRRRGREWFEREFLPAFAPVTILALLATLVLIFAFQAENITGKLLHVALIAVPILVQVYFNAALTYGLMRAARVTHTIAAPGALIGASNFFELAVATAIALFGPGSGAALATVVGVLVEVPVMLSVCGACNRTHAWFPPEPAAP